MVEALPSAKNPGGQGMHFIGPAKSLYLPGGHAEHLSPVPVIKGGHMLHWHHGAFLNQKICNRCCADTSSFFHASLLHNQPLSCKT